MNSVQNGLCTVWQLEAVIAMVMVCLQIGRRLYECLFVSVFSDSRMHWLHYILGLYFYTAVGPMVFYHLANRTCKCVNKHYQVLALIVSAFKIPLKLKVRWLRILAVLQVVCCIC